MSRDRLTGEQSSRSVNGNVHCALARRPSAAPSRRDQRHVDLSLTKPYESYPTLYGSVAYMLLMEKCLNDGGELLQRAQEANDFAFQIVRPSNRCFADSMTLEMIPNQLIGIEFG